MTSEETALKLLQAFVQMDEISQSLSDGEEVPYSAYLQFATTILDEFKAA